MAFVGVLLLTGLSFVHSFPYIRGFFLYKRALRARNLDQGERAAQLMAAASAAVPDEASFQGLSDLYKGLDLADRGKYKEAILPFRHASEILGENSSAPRLLIQVEGAVAFEEKRYEAFLERMTALRKLTGDTYDSLSRVAAALSCRFAETGDPTLKAQAIEMLEKTQKAGDFDAADFKTFEMRLKFRLATREVLTREVFEARFPNGWTEPAKGGK